MRLSRKGVATGGGGLFLCLLAGRLRAQGDGDPHAAQPERPTVATHAGTVAPRWFELESGVERDRVGLDNSTVTTPTLLKFGVGSRVQFDVMLTTVSPSSRQPWGVGDGGIGVKRRLAEGAPVLGDFAVQRSVKFPTGSEIRGTGTGTTDASLLLISSHVFGPTALDVNVGLTRRSNRTNSALWTVYRYHHRRPMGMGGGDLRLPGIRRRRHAFDRPAHRADLGRAPLVRRRFRDHRQRRRFAAASAACGTHLERRPDSVADRQSPLPAPTPGVASLACRSAVFPSPRTTTSRTPPRTVIGGVCAAEPR